MAYAAVISLKQTIQRLSKSCHISIVGNSSPLIKEFLYEEVCSLEQILESLDERVFNSNVERVNALDGQIRDAVYELEDVIETHISNLFLARSFGGEDDDPRSLLLSVDLKDLKPDFDSITQRLEKMKEAYIEEVMNPTPEEEQVNDPIWRPDFGQKRSKMVGLSIFYSEIRKKLTEDKWDDSVFLVGMAGIGKTALAKEIFEDPAIVDRFECRAWVTIGPKYQAKQILRSILAQVDPGTDKMLTWEGPDEEELGAYLMDSLKDRRYLVVLDDLWKDDLLTFLPCNGTNERVLITTRIKRRQIGGSFDGPQFPFLDKEESWQLLREKVFGEDGYCPRQLEKAGKKIAQNCEGLPLTIVEVAKILSEAEKTLEFWNKVAEKQNSVFFDAYDQMLEVLYPSYYYLPQFSKACFLYMGVFPQKYEIPLSKIINLWSAERFLEPTPSRSLEQIVTGCLNEFLNGNVLIANRKIEIMWYQNPNNFNHNKYHVNSALLHLCVNAARNNKFYRVLNCYNEDAEQDIKGQRRLCIRNNILFSIKHMCNVVMSISKARSLLCTGPYHQYPVPICFDLRLLRVLDVLTIRFYEFPVDVLKLIQLRYFGLTYDGKLPASISKLLNLESLIVNQHVSIKSSIAPSYLPMEVWNMQELKHLQVMGWDLPDPSEGSILPNLLTLLDVSTHSCTTTILKRIPNLKKLGIRIILAESNETEPFSFFYHIFHFHGLEKLKCIFTSPILTSEVVARPPRALPLFPSGLTRLSLGGLGYPWEEVRVIGSLPNLEVLRLRCYAFRGPKWETHAEDFLSLLYLSIEDSDLVVWIIGDNSFLKLGHLNIEHCYKLEEIQGELRSIRKIEVVDSNPLGVACAEQISYRGFHVKFTRRWEAEGVTDIPSGEKKKEFIPGGGVGGAAAPQKPDELHPYLVKYQHHKRSK